MQPPNSDLPERDDPDAALEEAAPEQGPLALGVTVIREHLRTMPATPGVYRMLNAAGDVLYVGKAKALKRRVVNYTQPDRLPNRLRRMVAETAVMEVVTTHTEVEALLLEINLIKQLKPRYNVLLRDDKSFPFILIARDHAFPQLVKHRGARSRTGDYFGPFASAGSVNRTLTTLQRAFLLRSCSDSIFSSRTRPCLLHQIKRCSAPCTGRIDKPDYDLLVKDAHAFLAGESSAVQKLYGDQMQAASANMEFETAAIYRDRLRALTAVTAHQDINVEGMGDADVIAQVIDNGLTCIQVFFFRGGQNYGTRAYFPANGRSVEPAEILAAFIGQFYADRPPPPSVLTSEAPAEAELLAEALSVRAGRKVLLAQPQRGAKRNLIEHALTNARDALGRRLAESSTQRKLLQGVADAFGLDAPPARVEVYDNSHIQGTEAVGGLIVAGPEGFMKSAYRKFNIRGPVTPGDDYGMMREVFERRFGRALKEDPDRSSGSWPDLVMIDGGLGQLSTATQVMAELGVADLPLVAIAKGPDRDAGRERFFMNGRDPIVLPMNDPVLYFLQRLRDEAHRWAIGTHRAKRSKAIRGSILDEVPGIGPGRKKALLLHFGSARAVAKAGLTDLEAVPGVNRAVAKKIYEHFHAAG